MRALTTDLTIDLATNPAINSATNVTISVTTDPTANMTANVTINPTTYPLLQLCQGELTMTLAPAIGGAVASFYSERTANGPRHHWLRPASAADLAAGSPNGMACYPMIPFCNRIRDGRFHFSGRRIVLPPNALPSQHPLHGNAWQRPWTVLSHEADAAQLSLLHERGDWPWRFEATQYVQLRGEGATLRLMVRNLDSEPMPLGVGFHPYFPQRAGARLTAQVAAMWHSDSELLPTSVSVAPVVAQLGAGVAAADLLLDNNFTGWDGLARIDFAAAADGSPARALELRADGPLDYLVIYAPPQGDFMCVEPVSNCTDWFNFPASERASVGGTVLAPGASVEVEMRLLTSWAGGQ